jgi:L-aspartate oxidase
MSKPPTLRRYLAHFDSYEVPQIFTDVLVIGSGIAGLSAALEACERCSVLMVTKGVMTDGCTNVAQGGIACAMAQGDSPHDHFEDTLKAGAGLCDEGAVRIVTEEAPARIRELLELGVAFDHVGQEDDGGGGRRLSFTLEGGHRRARILHADGDATGAAVEAVLVSRAREHESLRVLENTFAVDLLTVDGSCHGALIWSPMHGLMMMRAKRTILATGGCGRLYRESTNPAVATGDGVAIAYRAGAALQDLEFVQFHPTALYVAGAARALISESLRGEGAVLRNRDGEAFMQRYHPDADLAPRDTVSRSIMEEMKRTGHTHVYLDATHGSREYLESRFPTITGLCDQFGLNVAEDFVPVRPAAHYQIGGMVVDQTGRSTIDNLFACGEVACTGVHGANRLGSNSLLEGMVYGRRAGAAAGAACERTTEEAPLCRIQGHTQEPAYGSLNLADVENSLRSLMWRSVGVERNQRDLDEAGELIAFWCRYVIDKEFDRPEGWQLQNMLTAARLIVTSASRREESRGAHFRTDFPDASENWRRHIVVSSSDLERL